MRRTTMLNCVSTNHAILAANEANELLGLVRRFTFTDGELIRLLGLYINH